jgi:hypothetical protein
MASRHVHRPALKTRLLSRAPSLESVSRSDDVEHCALIDLEDHAKSVEVVDEPGHLVGAVFLIVFALIVALFIGLGFVVKWLFIIAVIAALIWLIAFFTGRARA